jgi:hypothetical protein
MRRVSFFGLWICVGCSVVESQDIATDAMSAVYTAEATEQGAVAMAVLRVGATHASTYVQLTGDDAISVTDGEQRVTLVESHIGNIYSYTAVMEPIADEAELVFAFERSVDAGAPDSRVSMPAAPTLTAPGEAYVFSRASDDIVVSWEPSGSDDRVRVMLAGPCISDWSTESDDSGSVTIPADEIEAVAGSDDASCEVGINLYLERVGELDPAFGEGGDILARQLRGVEIVSEP